MKKLYIVLGLSVGAMVFFTIAFILNIKNIRQGQAFYENLYFEVTQLDELTLEDRIFIVEEIEINLETKIELEIEMEMGTEIEMDSNEDEAHQTLTPFKSSIDFDSEYIKENYPTLVAWIKSENLNYPIVQGIDNSYYLSRLPNGKHHVMGSIFLDYRNLCDFSEQSIVIYGHDSRKGEMFGSLKQYNNQKYYEQNSSMLIFTPNCDYNLILIAGYIIDSAVEVPHLCFINQTDFDQYVNRIKKRSIFKSDVVVNYGEQLVHLVTCTPNGSINERLIIVGKLEKAAIAAFSLLGNCFRNFRRPMGALPPTPRKATESLFICKFIYIFVSNNIPKPII